MFAYCGNSPLNFADPTGEFGLSALCTIGAFAGGLINYAGEVIGNHRKGLKGVDAWLVEVNWGGVAASAFSGALSVIPGAGFGVGLCDVVGGAVIEHGINYMMGKYEGTNKLIAGMIVNAATSFIPLDKIPGVGELPRFIRNIKDEARAMGIKGTKKLETYLGFRQTLNILTTSFHSDTLGHLADTFVSPHLETGVGKAISWGKALLVN